MESKNVLLWAYHCQDLYYNHHYHYHIQHITTVITITNYCNNHYRYHYQKGTCTYCITIIKFTVTTIITKRNDHGYHRHSQVTDKTLIFVETLHATPFLKYFFSVFSYFYTLVAGASIENRQSTSSPSQDMTLPDLLQKIYPPKPVLPPNQTHHLSEKKKCCISGYSPRPHSWLVARLVAISGPDLCSAPVGRGRPEVSGTAKVLTATTAALQPWRCYPLTAVR